MFYIICKEAFLVNIKNEQIRMKMQEDKMSTTSLTGRQFMPQIHIRRGWILGAIMVSALIAFETFNYSTTDYALTDLLGELKFAGIRWATILSIAFCGIDFAGIARLFSPSEKPGSPRSSSTETWYLFSAWLLAATMNAMLTWWGVSLAVLEHQTLGSAVVERATLLRVVPIFVALMVWLIRVLIIGTFSANGDKLLAKNEARLSNSVRNHPRPAAIQSALSSLPQMSRPVSQPTAPIRPPVRATPGRVEASSDTRPEPTYHPLSTSAASVRRDQPCRTNTEPVRNGTGIRQ
jgi:hypothetical protein